MLHLGVAEQIFGVEIDDETAYRDDLTGQVPDSRLVREARQKELDFFEAKGLWVKRATDEARRRNGKPPIPVRWRMSTKATTSRPTPGRALSRGTYVKQM